MRISRRAVLGGVAAGAAALAMTRIGGRSRSDRRPNIIVLLTDDQGYNDIGCYFTPPDGAKAYAAIRTPRLDRMADEGVRLTDFYVAASICTPSRAALLTGCYPPRVGFDDWGEPLGVVSPRSDVGLSPDEVTIARMLRQVGYRTACIGKWHLGHHPPFRPNSHGFDYYFGIPWSNNQSPLMLMRNEEVVRNIKGRTPLIGEFTREAVSFVAQNRREPFFMYVAYSMPHEPWTVLPEFRGRSERGLYGDMVEAVDHHVGVLLDALAEQGLDEDTLVVFTSDNGPWAHPKGGSAWPFRGAKGDGTEGGYRSPCIWRWPGTLPAGQVNREIVTALDFLPTFAGLADAPLPEHTIDGHDAWPTLARGEPSPTEAFFYYARGRLEAVRRGKYKRVYDNPLRKTPVPAALYDLEADPGESIDLMDRFPEVVADLDARSDGMRKRLGDAILGVDGAEARPIGRWGG